MTHLPRPRGVTTACLFAGVMSLLLLIEVMSVLLDWGSLDVQEGISTALGGQDGLTRAGLSMTEALAWGRRLLQVVLVVLVAGVVFAIYAARGHRPSRLFLTGVCGVVGLYFVAFGGVLGVLPAAFAIACTFMLWSQDARAWFDVKNGRAPAIRETAPPAGAWPPPLPGNVDTSVHPAHGAPPTYVAPALRRPAAVQIAGLVTLVASSIVAVTGGVFLLSYGLARDELLRTQLDSPTMGWFTASEAELVDAMHSSALLCAIFVPLSLVAIGASILLLMGRSIGRTVTQVLAWITVPVGVVTLIGLPWSVAAVVVLVHLRKPESKAWFARS